MFSTHLSVSFRLTFAVNLICRFKCWVEDSTFSINSTRRGTLETETSLGKSSQKTIQTFHLKRRRQKWGRSFLLFSSSSSSRSNPPKDCKNLTLTSFLPYFSLDFIEPFISFLSCTYLRTLATSSTTVLLFQSIYSPICLSIKMSWRYVSYFVRETLGIASLIGLFLSRLCWVPVGLDYTTICLLGHLKTIVPYFVGTLLLVWIRKHCLYVSYVCLSNRLSVSSQSHVFFTLVWFREQACLPLSTFVNCVHSAKIFLHLTSSFSCVVSAFPLPPSLSLSLSLSSKFNFLCNFYAKTLVPAYLMHVQQHACAEISAYLPTYLPI